MLCIIAKEVGTQWKVIPWIHTGLAGTDRSSSPGILLLWVTTLGVPQKIVSNVLPVRGGCGYAQVLGWFSFLRKALL